MRRSDATFLWVDSEELSGYLQQTIPKMVGCAVAVFDGDLDLSGRGTPVAIYDTAGVRHEGSP